MKTYSTKQAAAKAEIHWVTLHRWLARGSVRASDSIRMNGTKLWRWTESDVEKIKKYKQENYRKGRGRKAKAKRGRK
jgi:predicted site-specific integrase-resolvase